MAEGDMGRLVKESFIAFGGEWKVLVSLALLLSILPMIIFFSLELYMYGIVEKVTPVGMLGEVVTGLLSVLLTLGIISAVRGKTPLDNTFRHAGGRYWAGLGLTILIILALIPLFILLIIPGIAFTIYWAFAYYFLMDGKGVIDSMKESFRLVRGKWWRVFGYTIVVTIMLMLLLILAMIPLGILGFILTLVAEPAGFFFISLSGAIVNAFLVVYLAIFYQKFYELLKSEAK